MSDSNSKINRRHVMAGAGAVGAAAVVASVVGPMGANTAVNPAVADKPAKGGGYRLSEHVKHYYQTARV